MKKSKGNGREKIYNMVTDAIVKKLEQGIVPWKKSWFTLGGAPRNLITDKAYRGVNTLLCSGFDNPYFLTYKQCSQLGGNIIKGEKSTPIVFWAVNKYEKVNDKGELEDKQSFILRYYNVFNVTQCENIDHKRLRELQDKLENTEREENADNLEQFDLMTKDYINSLQGVKFGGNRACYIPSKDMVEMPNRENFVSDDDFISVFSHELVHSTGNKKRLDRLEKQASFGSKDYSKEELVAEIGSGFICGLIGIDRIESNTAYIQSWLKALKNDNTLIMGASTQAKKAIELILV